MVIATRLSQEYLKALAMKLILIKSVMLTATVETIGGQEIRLNNWVGRNTAYAGVIGLFNEFDLTQVGDATKSHS